MKLLLLSALVVVALSHPLDVSEEDHAQWELFKVAHEREYDTPEEELKRKNVFLENLQFVREHNEKFENGEVSFDVEINKFSDLTTEEFVTMMNGYKHPVVHERTGDAFDDSENVKLPKNVDWRKKGAVTGVKDQGHCGASWTFSATGSLEGQHYLKTKKLVSLSEQNLIDCSTAEGNSGCRGGLADTAYIYIQTNNGIDTEASYPYEAKQKTCRYNPKNKGATDNGFVAIQSFSEPDLQKAVATVGPISVAIDGSHTTFKHYKSGVYKQAGCSTMVVGQAVLAVGYGSVKKGGDYWLVKNSWGTGWGMNGYVMMARNDNNMCGIASMAGYPKV
ncbi:procathepsin L-like [Homalodisca vitripennis]|uniref:procathepsin L-like n=1 Tax=Homalodisca vitripennis TaxID=197043 RepID=UPI001EEC5C8F|nr:procathepsin L-like [Homalodisca vitripennis]